MFRPFSVMQQSGHKLKRSTDSDASTTRPRPAPQQYQQSQYSQQHPLQGPSSPWVHQHHHQHHVQHQRHPMTLLHQPMGHQYQSSTDVTSSTPLVFNKAVVVFSTQVSQSQLDARGRLVFGVHHPIDEWRRLLTPDILHQCHERSQRWQRIINMEEYTAAQLGLHHIFGAPHVALHSNYVPYLQECVKMGGLFHRVIRFNAGN
jgi:hypothetical protein